MQVKNLGTRDIIFQFEAASSTPTQPVFATVNIVAGWTVDIADTAWSQIEKQEQTVQEWDYEEIASTVQMKDADGKSYTPVRRNAFLKSEKTVNMIEHMVKTRQIELVKEESNEDAREKFAKAAKLMGIKVTDKMSLESIKEAIDTVKAIL